MNRIALSRRRSGRVRALPRRWARAFHCGVAAALLHATPALAQSGTVTPEKPLAVGRTFTLRSAVLGEVRRINVYAPPVYADSPGVRLPVLYMPDGGMAEDFLHVAGLVQVSVGNGTMRPFLLVGIENTERRRDLTGPTANAEDRKIAPRVAGSAKFRDFIRTELMPAIEARYRTTDETAIIGESLAGLFVVETYFVEPELFDAYIAFDPSLWWNDEALVKSAADHVPSAGVPRLYLASSGEKDLSRLTRQLYDVLRAKAPAGLAVDYRPMPAQTHATIYHPAALEALRTLFAPRMEATPVQAYRDWTRLDFERSEYDARRSRLIEELRTLGDGVLLIPSAEGTSHGPSFRQLDDFHYWTGLELPSSMLVVDGRAGTAVVYAPGRDARFENRGRLNDFPGRPLADDPSIAEQAGIEVRDIARLEAEIGRLASGRTLYVDLGGADPDGVRTGLTADLSPEELLVLHLRRSYPAARIGDAFPAIAHVRAVKSPAEIERIRQVARITEEAITLAASHVAPGIDERELEGWFELGCRQGGAQRTPFHPIIKSGPNSLWPWRILASHYDRRNRDLEDGDIVILDVGCELDHYVSDVGRTFPVSGRFSAAQAAALEMQRRVSAAIIAAIRPGVTLADVQKAADAAIPAAERPYMQTGSYFGHHLGLSTGDPVLTAEPLKAGMVLTVEPWYYNHETGISVFVEDMILVTDSGAEVLTSTLPRTADALAEMVRRRARWTGRIP